jgi:hypothetical protein
MFSVLTLAIIGCGSPKNSVKKGDRLIVQEVLREKAETQWDDSHTDGFIKEIPIGTVLEVVYAPRTGSSIVECIPVEVEGIKDADSVEQYFVPENIYNTDGYKTFSFSMKLEYIGKQLKKAE